MNFCFFTQITSQLRVDYEPITSPERPSDETEGVASAEKGTRVQRPNNETISHPPRLIYTMYISRDFEKYDILSY